jgi:hypothetical protein
MSLSDIKILVSGDGYTYTKSSHKTWANIFQLVGCKVVDVSGPGVSNQWIVNKTFLELQKNTGIDTAFVQLADLGKLDVEVDIDRINNLVKPDPLRNFVIDRDLQVLSDSQIGDWGIWPSSCSDCHESKKQWQKWLFSPALEKEDLYCKLVLLENFCKERNIKLCVYHGFYIDWNSEQRAGLQHMIRNIDDCITSAYQKSPHYQNHDHHHQNLIPCLGYQLELAQTIGKELPMDLQQKLLKFKLAYGRT